MNLDPETIDQVERYCRPVLGRRLPADEVDDAIQAVYRRLLAAPPVAMRHPERYVATVARNVALDARRAQGRAPRNETALVDPEHPDRAPYAQLAAETPDDDYRAVVQLDGIEAPRDVALAVLHEQLAAMRPRDRDALVEAYSEALAPSGTRFRNGGLPPGVTKVQLCRARQRLRRALLARLGLHPEARRCG